ncbi:flagellar hook-length control protein FliK [Roseimaritima sediminicola]|uniref:flagellar hook-length control protein FliK n=1 Tax=Roseimaritima sediminicola TaxID=2662066 RepID=UPI0012985499|nr:flagellar hook-length control protein FliK [Roseimaritima sediminicola]
MSTSSGSSVSSVYSTQTPHAMTRLARSLHSGSVGRPGLVPSGLVPAIGGDAFAEVFQMMAAPAAEPSPETTPAESVSSRRPEPAESAEPAAEETSANEDGQDERAADDATVQTATDPALAVADTQPVPAVEDAAAEPATSDTAEQALTADAGTEEGQASPTDAANKPAGDAAKTPVTPTASGEDTPAEASATAQPSATAQTGQAELAGGAERTAQRTDKPAVVSTDAEGPAAPTATDAQHHQDSADGQPSSSAETPEVRYAGEAGEDQGDRRSRHRGRSSRDRVNPNSAGQNPATPSPAADAAAALPQRAAAAAEAAAAVQEATNSAAAAETAGEFQPPTAPAHQAAAAAAIRTTQPASAGKTATSAAAPTAAANGPAGDGGGAARDPLSATTTEATTNRQGRSSAAEAQGNEGPRVADRAVLIQRVSRAFQRIGVAGGQVRIRLHPEELGGVQLQMNVQGQRISASVVAETEAARSILTQHLPELRQRLADQGMQVERLEVHLEGEQDGQEGADLLRQDRGGHASGFGSHGSGGWLGGQDPAWSHLGRGRQQGDAGQENSSQGRAGQADRDAGLRSAQSRRDGASVIEAAARKRVDLIG